MEQADDHITGTRTSKAKYYCSYFLYLSSLRNLCRALQFARDQSDNDILRSLYEVTSDMAHCSTSQRMHKVTVVVLSSCYIPHSYIENN